MTAEEGGKQEPVISGELDGERWQLWGHQASGMLQPDLQSSLN